MIRFIIRKDDANMAANVGGSVKTTFKTFDFCVPIIEDWLKENNKNYEHAYIQAIEILESPTAVTET